jgi:glycosyltransferase involved in cell wall biosynthesis
MRAWHHRLIGRASLALCNGQDTLNAFGRLNDASYLIHDLHVDANPKLAQEMGNRKEKELCAGIPLKLCYTGRMDPEKAPLEWVRALAHARQLGSRFEATWLGDGSLRGATEKLATEMGLQDVITFPGFIADRERVMKAVAQSHAMVFTHVTPESPRCLLEALMHATPIIGYDTDYSKGLTREAGGLHVANGDYLALGSLIFDLDRNREAFARLVGGAKTVGQKYSGSDVFRFRSELIKRHLDPRATLRT